MYNYNYYPQQTQTQVSSQQPSYNYLRPQVPQGLKGRPVSSLDEVRAAAIDFDGSVFYFPDYANKCIYTKQINMDGTATMCVYELVELPVSQTPTPINTDAFITREEFETALTQLKATLSSQQPTAEPVRPQIKSF